MKRFTPFALGVAGLACMPPGAQAQSSVTLFGTIDMGVTRVTGGGSSRTGLSNGGANINRFGFRGQEDLGGGLVAGFWLEAGYAPDVGTAVGGFNRRATVSLSGRWGELRLGRDDSASFLNTLVFDPFLANGVAGNNAVMMNGAPIQISNAISYFTPAALGGFYAHAQHVLNERQASNATAGRYSGLRLGWRQGGTHLSVAAGEIDGVPQQQDLRIRNLGLSHSFGAAHPMLLWASEKRGGVEIRGLNLGVKLSLGAGEIRASLGRYSTSGSDADWRKLGLGYGHNLSKRTQLYATYARLSNSPGSQRSIGVIGVAPPGTAPGGLSQGYEVGMRHFF